MSQPHFFVLRKIDFHSVYALARARPEPVVSGIVLFPQEAMYLTLRFRYRINLLCSERRNTDRKTRHGAPRLSASAQTLQVARVSEYVVQLLRGEASAPNSLARPITPAAYSALLPTIWSLLNSEAAAGEEGWRNREGERLADFGVDEVADFYDEAEEDEDVPLGQLLARRKREGAMKQRRTPLRSHHDEIVIQLRRRVEHDKSGGCKKIDSTFAAMNAPFPIAEVSNEAESVCICARE